MRPVAVLRAGLQQPDARSCGAAAMVMARAVREPAYADDVTDGSFSPEVLAAHRRLTSARLRGRWQLPWPRALGTPPWAVARELSALTGVRHRTRVVRWSRPAARGGEGALYVGSRLLPRHVVLLVDGDDDDPVRCYEPSSGRVVPIDLPYRPLAGWRYAWFAVEPR